MPTRGVFARCQLRLLSANSFNPTGITRKGVLGHFLAKSMIHVANMPFRGSVAHLRPLDRRENPFLMRRVRAGMAPAVPFTGTTAEAEQAALYPGYYLRSACGANYWIGASFDEAYANRERAGDLFLSPVFGHEYDIEYSFGCVVGGSSAWANLSASDRFF